MVHLETFKKPRYTALLSKTDFQYFTSRALNGMSSLAFYCEISFRVLVSRKVRVNLFLIDEHHLNTVRNIVKAGNFNKFELKNPYKRKPKKV